MPTVKKLIFAPFFLISFGLLLYFITPTLKSFNFLFSLSVNNLLSLIVITCLIFLSSFFFVLFATLANSWKIVLPLGIIASLLPLIILKDALGLVFTVGMLISLLVSFINLENSLKSYLNFKPEAILGPSIKHLSSLLILVICVTYFLSINKIIQEQGFEIPDSLIDTAINLSSPQSQVKGMKIAQGSALTPELLKQYGIDPSVLDTLNNSANITKEAGKVSQDLIKQAVKDQIQGFLKPYLGFIPALLAVLLFFTLQSLTSILSLLIYPLLWVIFYILEKTGFVRFEKEMREVKKLVV